MTPLSDERLAEIKEMAVDCFNHWDGPTQQVVDDLVEEVDRLRAIVAKLPVTADGVPVTPGMKLYSTAGGSGEVTTVGEKIFGFYSESPHEIAGAKSLYSTREAAAAAREGER